MGNEKSEEEDPGDGLASYAIRRPERSAAPLVRGVRYQVLRTVEALLQAAPEQVLVCEGNEDFDLCLPGSAQETQVKAVRARLTINSTEIVEAIGHFLVSYVAQREAAVPTRFVFLSTGPCGSLRRWPAESPKTGRRRAQEAMMRWMAGECVSEKIFDRGLASIWRKLDKVARVALKRVRDENWLLEFQNSVDFRLGEPATEEAVKQLENDIAHHHLFEGLPADDVVQRLQDLILRASSQDLGADRMLRRFDLECIATNAAIAHAEHHWVSLPAGAKAFLEYQESSRGSHCLLLLFLAASEEPARRLDQVCDQLSRNGFPCTNLEDVLQTPNGREWLRGLDMQVFAYVDPTARFRRARSRMFVAFHQLKKQAVDGPRTVLTSSHSLAVALQSQTVEIADAREVGCRVANILATTILHTYPDGITTPSRRSPVLLDCVAKIRCIYDRDQRRYYTRETPIPLVTADPQGSPS